jgi:hypothetical protein
MELTLDAAFDVFINGWYDRGRWVLADSKRAETLPAAADQLRNLSHEPADGLPSDAGLATPTFIGRMAGDCPKVKPSHVVIN